MLLSDGWIRYIRISHIVFPAEPSVNSCDRPKAEIGAVVDPRTAFFRQVREKSEILGELGRFPYLFREFLSVLPRRKVALELNIVFARKVGAAKKVKRGPLSFDEMIADAPAEDGAQVQILQGIGHEIGIGEDKEPRR